MLQIFILSCFVGTYVWFYELEISRKEGILTLAQGAFKSLYRIDG